VRDNISITQKQETGMPTSNDTALVNELTAAIDELQIALQGASSAAARINGLLPRLSAVNALLDDIESMIQARRLELGGEPEAPATFARPTLVVTEMDLAEAPPVVATAVPQPLIEESTADTVSAPRQGRAEAAELICFRLEFQSNSGPLDLRAVDDAVSEHPAVRDVALLDYDGRRATLKVWITTDASPSDVQQALTERAGELFADAGDVTIVALEDAA
jgi:hypothetical protein